ncbi:MAG TPA: hypothetical protein VFK54_06045, partial [Candidatus Limnocylindrales bacterium]|nr:hypothetical protein [Candidatus Limnocylindrales bacterium]
MSASVDDAAIAAGRRTAADPAPTEADLRPVPVAIVGATGYAGAELIRLLARHPGVRIVGLVGRERKGDPVGTIHPHLGTLDLAVHDEVPADAEVVFLAMPHGAAAARAP